MKLLIIGKTGQLGNALINDASLLNYSVIAPPRQELDITKISNNSKFLRLLKENKPDVVINTAAYNNVIECESNQLYAFDVNCIAVKNMAEITNKLDILFITFSTDYVFDGKTQIPYIETDMPHPINMYGISKLSGEYASLMYDNTIVIRTCGLYGLNSTSTKSGKGNFVDNRINDSKNNQFIQIGCDQTISPTFVNDLSKAIIQLIEHPIKKYNLYHLVNEGHCTWYELTCEIYDILNIETEVIPINHCGVDRGVKKPLFSALRNERAKELGIMLPHWKDALRRYLKQSMEIIMKAKISPRITLENRTKLEEVIPLSTPITLFVDPSSVCNFKCKFCPTGHSNLIRNTERWQGQMNLDLYKKIIDDIGEFDKPLKILRLYKDGEPLLNKNLHKMVRYAKDSGYVNYIDTTTNGFLINNFRMKPIIDAGLNKINISVNGMSDEQFLEFSGVRVDFKKYVENIANLYEIKGDCEIFIKITGDYLTNEEKERFYHTFGDICDKISIENTAPCWNEFDVEKYVNIKISQTKGIYGNELTDVSTCPYIFYMLSINSDGTVSLCFLDWNRKLVIGDVNKQSIKEIWNSDILYNYQIDNLNGKRNELPICNKCGQLKYCLPDNIDKYANMLINRIRGII